MPIERKEALQLPVHGEVYLVEDDRAVRDSLQLLLRLRGFGVTALASAEAFLVLADSLSHPACVLADVRLPGMSGLELQASLRRSGNEIPVVMMTAHGDVATARGALRDGAVDFLEKPIDESDLLEAIGLAIRGDLDRIERLRQQETMRSRLKRLSERELDVFQRVTDGQTNREIAEALGISQRTVEVHRAHMMDKLDARRIADLFRVRFDLDERVADRAGKRPRSAEPSSSA